MGLHVSIRTAVTVKANPERHCTAYGIGVSAGPESLGRDPVQDSVTRGVNWGKREWYASTAGDSLEVRRPGWLGSLRQS